MSPSAAGSQRVVTAAPVPPAKASRYRSLRGKSVSESRQADENGADPHEGGRGGGLRYSSRKRSKTIAAAAVAAASGAPPVPPVPSSLPLAQRELNIPSKPGKNKDGAKRPTASLRESETLGSIPYKFPAPPVSGVVLADVPVATAITVDTAVEPTRERRAPRQQQQQQQQQQQDDGDDEERRRRRRLQEDDEAARWADEVARLEAETDRILAEQKKRDLARLQAQLAARHPVSPPPQKARGSPVLEKFAFLTRGRRSNAATLSPTSSACVSVDLSRANSLEPTLQPRAFIGPAADAPNMAVSGGGGGERVRNALSSCFCPFPVVSFFCSFPSDGLIACVFLLFFIFIPLTAGRLQVQVRCKQLSMELAVTADTTAVDILYGCSEALTHPINTACSVVLERYVRLGLERRLRRYEKIADVVRSWDRDGGGGDGAQQNSLLVLPADSFESDRDLEAAAVPNTADPPQGFILQLYHSPRPGKWHKRFVTLLEGGQLFACKKIDAELSLSSSTSAGSGSGASADRRELCHLADCDIYTPTEAQMRKQLKPPKKYCYAVKSQRRPAAFGDPADGFVHFFCTEDLATAQKFHSLVHLWRSWHLLHQKADLQRQTRRKILNDGGPPQIAPAHARHKPSKSVSHVRLNNGHRLKVSVDESPYPIGAFEPLLDLGRFDKPLDDFGKDWIPDPRQSVMARRSLSQAALPPPAANAARDRQNNHRHRPPLAPRTGAASSSRLGRQRQAPLRAQRPPRRPI